MASQTRRTLRAAPALWRAPAILLLAFVLAPAAASAAEHSVGAGQDVQSSALCNNQEASLSAAAQVSARIAAAVVPECVAPAAVGPALVSGPSFQGSRLSWLGLALALGGAFLAGTLAGAAVLFVRGRGREPERPSAAAEAGPIVRAIDITKTYDTGKVKVQALRGVSLEIARGEMVAIMGASGCGKTTLLNCLSGLDTVDFGRVIVDGVDLGTMSDNDKTEYRARRMGFVFQFYNLLPVLSAVENVELPLLVSGVPSNEARRRAVQALERVHLRQWADHRPAELSGGQRQRVTIARALVNDPAIVWGDEPTGDLDSITAGEIMDLLCDLNERHGQTFIMVTHAQEVADRTGRIVRMQDGQIISDERALDRAAGLWAPSAKIDSV